MPTKTQIIVAMEKLDDTILNGATEAIQIAAYEERMQYADMLFNHKYVY